MKTQKYWNSITPALLLLVSSMLYACGSMDETYEQFLEGGEKIYVAKADSIKILPGRNRVELSWLLLGDPKVSRYKVYWNNKQDFIENQVTKTDGIDTVRLEIKDLVEGSHTFQIFTFDSNGNSSVKAEVAGRAYGEHYENSLLNATMSKQLRKGEDWNIIWNKNQPEGLAVMEIEYQNTEDQLVRTRFSNFSDTTKLKKFPLKGTYQFRSGFLPDSLALDTFYVKYEQIKTN